VFGAFAMLDEMQEYMGRSSGKLYSPFQPNLAERVLARELLGCSVLRNLCEHSWHSGNAEWTDQL
jgi:hypothetical protein